MDHLQFLEKAISVLRDRDANASNARMQMQDSHGAISIAVTGDRKGTERS